MRKAVGVVLVLILGAVVLAHPAVLFYFAVGAGVMVGISLVVTGGDV